MNKTQLSGTGKGVIENNNLEQHVKSNSFKRETRKLEPGKHSTTFNGGQLVPIMYMDVLPGTYIKSWNVKNMTRMLTPLVPTFDTTFITIRADFVPYTRIWSEAEEIMAGKSSQKRINSGMKNNLPSATILNGNTLSGKFRNTLAARMGVTNNAHTTNVNLLYPRAYRAIVNDMIINKDYDIPKIEWKETLVTSAEQAALRAYTATGTLETSANEATLYKIENAPARKNYFTNIKKRLSAPFQDQIITEVVADLPAPLIWADGDIPQQRNWRQDPLDIGTHLDWQTNFMDLKQREVNANKNDWDIIAEMGGTAPVRTDRVEHLGSIDYELNYQQITQTTPVIDNSEPLGTTGSFSFTKIGGALFNHKEFRQHGIIIVTISTSMDTLFEKGTPRELMKTYVEEIYRPGLAKKEIQLLKTQEVANVTGNTGNTLAYQPAWAEYKRLPSFVTGDMRSTLLTKVTSDTYIPNTKAQWNNFLPNTVTAIDQDYFNNASQINTTLARNNAISSIWNTGQKEFIEDIFMNMSEHHVEVSLPIEDNILSQTTKAEQTR